MIDDLTVFYEIYGASVQSGQRRGQALMNALAVTDFDSYQNVTGTDADCFYNDNLIPNFRKAVLDGESE